MDQHVKSLHQKKQVQHLNLDLALRISLKLRIKIVFHLAQKMINQKALMAGSSEIVLKNLTKILIRVRRKQQGRLVML